MKPRKRKGQPGLRRVDPIAIPPRPLYVNQLARARRLLDRVANRTAPSQEAFLARLDDYQDDLYSFFVSCWHVKDWLQNDPLLSSAIGADAIALVVKDVHRSFPLLICGDVANGIKHLGLTEPKIGSGAKVAMYGFRHEVGGAGISFEHFIIVPEDRVRGTHEAHETAYEVGCTALREWRRILEKHALPLPPRWTDPQM